MIILPAIDLKDGKCVRLKKGDFSTASEVSNDALKTAEFFREAGAQTVHMVDLDGALGGSGKNRAIVRSVIENSGLAVELGGGLRSVADLEAADGLGVYRMVIGTKAVEDTDFVKQAVKRYGNRIAVGIDALGGHVRTAGWTVDSGVDYIDFAKRMEEIGVKYIIFTDIDTDGMLSGPSLKMTEALVKSVSCGVIASGGVTTNADIITLKNLGVYGTIIGKAVYAGTIDLRKAIEEAGEQCIPKE